MDNSRDVKNAGTPEIAETPATARTQAKAGTQATAGLQQSSFPSTIRDISDIRMPATGNSASAETPATE
jgi:hypothetical protein